MNHSCLKGDEISVSKASIKKNTIFSLIKNVSTILFPIITFPYISRTLLPDNIGKINFGSSIVSYFSLLASLGIGTHAIRECSGVRNDKKRLDDTASQIFSINIITTCIAYLALGLTLIFCRRFDNYRTLIIIQSLGILAGTLGADWINSAMEDFKYITIRSVAVQIVSLVLMFLFVHSPDDYMKYAVISLVSSAGANITNVWYRRRYVRTRFTLKIEWNRHIGPIVYMFVMALAGTIFNSVDSTMLGFLCGDAEVGIYGTAHKIYNVAHSLIFSLTAVVTPRISNYFATGNFDEINRLLRKVLEFNLVFGLPCAVGCWEIAESVIRVACGAEFISAAPVLRIFSLSLMVALVGGDFLGNVILLPFKQERYYMIVCIITAVVNIIGNYFFIPLFGARGAAATTVACGVCIFILLLLKVDKRVKLGRIGKLFISPLVGCAGIVAVCETSKLITAPLIQVFVSVVVSAFVYFLIQIIMKNQLVTDFWKNLENKIKLSFGRE